MPELPEVETVCTGLKEVMIGQEIISLTEYTPNTVSGDFPEHSLHVSNISRRGKYILIHTKEEFLIVIHLRMTGKCIYDPSGNQISPHLRATFDFQSGSKVLFDDTRTFGTIQLLPPNVIDNALKSLGPEPLTEDYNAAYLYTISRKKKKPIKNLLLDQTIIAGLGNIYVCETLYRARIMPDKPAGLLSKKQVEAIVKHSKEVLQEAIIHNGTSISDFRRVDDKTGEFQQFLQIYQKKDCPKGHAVSNRKLAGRSSFYCPVCQK